MQREIMAHGPIEVSYYIYSDFAQYRGGVYRRSAQARGPVGGHAVKLIGWGEEGGQPYWLAVNSWSPLWGEGGQLGLRGVGGWCLPPVGGRGLPPPGRVSIHPREQCLVQPMEL